MFDYEALALQDLERMADRLPGDVEAFGDFLLRQPDSWCEGAVSDGIDHPAMDLFDQIGNEVERFHRGIEIRNAKFRIRNSKNSVKRFQQWRCQQQLNRVSKWKRRPRSGRRPSFGDVSRASGSTALNPSRLDNRGGQGRCETPGVAGSCT